MAITDQHVAALRAVLLGQHEEHKRLLDLLSEEETKKAYLPLLSSAFFEAARRRFRGKSKQDMIEWIANVRATMDPAGRINPDTAERLILWVFNKASTDGMDFHDEYFHQTALLALLVEEQQYDESGLEEFLSKAREIAEQVAP